MLHLVILNLKRNKKSWSLLTIVLFLGYLFITMGAIFFASLDRTEEIQREEIYGSWHVALLDTDIDTMDRLKNHGTLEQSGLSYTYGDVLDAEGDRLGKLGTVDSDTIEMENISLLAGRFPTKEGEVAVEQSALLTLGYTTELDQEIKVTVQSGKKDSAEVREESYRVVGVLRNYASKMKGINSDKKDYVSFIVHGHSKQPVRGNLVCRMKKTTMEFYKEILRAIGNSGTAVENNYTYFGLMGETSYQQKAEQEDRILLFFVGLVIVLCFAINVFGNYVKSRRRVHEILWQFGTEKKTIQSLIRKEILLVNLSACVLGTLMGIGFPLLFGPCLNHVDEITLYVEVPWETVILFVGIALLFVTLVMNTAVPMVLWLDKKLRLE